MNSKKANEYYTEKVTFLEAKVDSLEVENESLRSVNMDLNYFSLLENDAAYSYFADQGLDVDKIAVAIESEIIDRNRPNADNELIPFAGMEGKMRVNHIKILNNHWIIADFTDGIYWGEVLLDYEIDESKNLSITTKDGFLYPRRR